MKNTANNMRHENHIIKKKSTKAWKKNLEEHFLWCEDYADNFKLQEVKMTKIKCLEKNHTVLFVDLVNEDL